MSTIDRYLRDKQIDLAHSIAGRTKVYLDQRYWIIARDAAAGVRIGASSRKLLHYLRRGVANGSLICPIGTSTFLELMKQPLSEARRIGTAKLIDELSLGITLLPSQTIMATEIHSTFLARMGKPIYEMQELVWTKVAYVLGPVHPTLPHLDAETELQIQKAFVDKMWEQTLTAMVQMIGDAEQPEDDFEGVAARIDRENAEHADSIRSFEKTYRDELKGVADDHAVSALGYCDAFLTEGPLHHLTSEPRLALAKINNCRILSDLDEAVDFLRLA